jgi:hypothetical protein
MDLPKPTKSDVLWVVDGNHPILDALTWMDQLMGNMTVKIFNFDDLVKACAQKAIKNSTPVKFLSIFGHGTGGYQSVGAGKKYEDTGTKSLRWKSISRPGSSELEGPAEGHLKKLNGLLAEDATILLGGCNVGEGDYGTGLLRSVSTILNSRRVQAFEWAVYWWSGVLMGPLKEAKGSAISSSFSTYSL